MDPAGGTLLREIYRPDVARLAELLGRSPPWEALVAGGSPPG
jgi:hypothetical protein